MLRAARKVECRDVGKIVARGEIEMIKKEDRAVVTQRITARKVECGNVRKIVARCEIEMIKTRREPPLVARQDMKESSTE